MSRLNKRKDVDIFSLSFLDIIACGFGAIVLLLLITKTSGGVSDQATNQDDVMANLFEQMRQVEILENQVTELKRKLSEEETRVTEVLDALTAAQRAKTQAQSQQDATIKVLNDMNVARQSLTEEMRRLLDQNEKDEDVGGIPVDSEYVIFVVDTSGSMQQIWSQVIAQIENVLNIHPTVKGFQIMNDQGRYLFEGYRREWMSDTPSMRKGALDLIRSWTDFSNSDPVNGIEAAIRTFYDGEKKISVFVFGDEFSGESVEQTIRMIERINVPDSSGQTRVRIHAVGFINEYALSIGTTGRFAHLMREVTQRNNGTFIALPN